MGTQTETVTGGRYNTSRIRGTEGRRARNKVQHKDSRIRGNVGLHRRRTNRRKKEKESQGRQDRLHLYECKKCKHMHKCKDMHRRKCSMGNRPQSSQHNNSRAKGAKKGGKRTWQRPMYKTKEQEKQK